KPVYCFRASCCARRRAGRLALLCGGRGAAAMSAEAYKRDLVAGWCAAVTAAPFVPTINNNATPDGSSATWFTVEWGADQVEQIGYCGIVQETGQLSVIVAGEPNLGDSLVAIACDEIVAELLAQADPEKQFTLERAGATAEHSNGSADRWYRLLVPLEYRLISGGP